MSAYVKIWQSEFMLLYAAVRYYTCEHVFTTYFTEDVHKIEHYITIKSNSEDCIYCVYKEIVKTLSAPLVLSNSKIYSLVVSIKFKIYVTLMLCE